MGHPARQTTARSRLTLEASHAARRGLERLKRTTRLRWWAQPPTLLHVLMR